VTNLIAIALIPAGERDVGLVPVIVDPAHDADILHLPTDDVIAEAAE